MLWWHFIVAVAVKLWNRVTRFAAMSHATTVLYLGLVVLGLFGATSVADSKGAAPSLYWTDASENK